MGKFLYLVKPPKVNQGAINNINIPITNEIEIVIKSLPDKVQDKWIHRRILQDIQRNFQIFYNYPKIFGTERAPKAFL